MVHFCFPYPLNLVVLSALRTQFDPVTRAAKDPIWVDPVPLEVLCKGRVNATWCPGDDDEGEEDEDEDDAGDRR